MTQMLEFVDNVLDPLGTREDVEYIKTMLREGTSADRQLACYEKTGSLKTVIAQLSEETLENCK